MIDESDQRLDLSPLNADRESRAASLSARVVARVSAAREQARQRDEIRDGVRRRLARFALPGALAAAISFLTILATGARETPGPGVERFTLMVMGQTPAARWIALNQPPEIEELLQAMRGR